MSDIGLAERPRLEIVQVVRRMHPQGGVGGVAWALDHELRRLGVSVVSITADSLWGRPAIGTSGRLAGTLEIARFTLAATWAARLARARGAVVVVHGDALGGDIYVDHGLHKALLARRPWLLLHPLHLFICAREELRHALGGYGRLACLSQGGEAALLRAYPWARRGRLARLCNGVDVTRFRPDPARMRRPLDAADAQLVFVGHEFGRKGLRHVIDALVHLPDGVRLRVAGGGDVAWARRFAQRRGVAARVDILGARRDVDALLRRSDLLVLPSVCEAWPLVTLEAMASGVPVLISDIPAAAEILGDGEGGRVTARSGRAIAQAIKAMIVDPDGFVALRAAAWARAQRFAWPQVAERYLDLAQDVRRSRARPA